MHIEDYRNKHAGERAFIVGNGPSLEQTPLDELTDEYTFATNRINKIYDETEWRPTYHTMAAKDLTKKYHNSLMEVTEHETVCFVSSKHTEQVTYKENIHFIDIEKYHDPKYECFETPEVPERSKSYWSDDISEKVYFYNTSLYPLFQLANYMGFERLYLLGCDLGFDPDWWPIFNDGPDPLFFHQRYYDNYNNKMEKYIDYVKQSDSYMKAIVNGFGIKFIPILYAMSDNYHFSDDYQGMFEATPQRGTDNAMRRAHILGKKKLNERNVEVYNATYGGELEVYPRVNFEQVF